MNESIYKEMRRRIRMLKYWYREFYILGNNEAEEIYENSRTNLEQFEEKYQNYIQEDSPSLTLGYLSHDLPVKKHMIPMLSISHSYEKESAYKKVEKMQEMDLIIMEPKVDGVALSLQYLDGWLDCCLLRGNGYEGEDILPFIQHLNIPNQISLQKTCIIRGELYLQNSDRSNDHLRTKISGLLRRKSFNKINFDQIKFIAYDVFHELVLTRMDANDILKSLGFNAVPYIRYTGKIIKFQSCLYETDGIVFKINNYNLSKSLGYTARYSRSLFSYKFNRSSTLVCVKNIIWSMKRTGALIPTLEISPTKIDNVIVRKIAAHNKSLLHEKKCGVGSEIFISRVGNTAPQIMNIQKKSENLILLDYCPFCKKKVNESEINYICNNINCYKLETKQAEYFLKSLKIKGLGVKKIEKLIQQFGTKLSRLIGKLYEGIWIQDQNDQKIYKILKNKHYTTIDIWVSLGIPGISRSVLKKFLSCKNNLDNNDSILYNRWLDYKKKYSSLAQTLQSIMINNSY